SKRGYHVLLGLAGGLAWWTSPLVIYALLAAGAFVVLRDKLAGIRRGAVLSLPAFFVGAAPFFYFYATDPYSSTTSLGGGFGLDHIPAGLYLLLVERVPRYLDWSLLGRRADFGRGLAAVVYGWATLFFLWRLRQSFRAQHPLRHAAVFPILFVVFVLLFAASSHIRRDSPQYVIPLSAFFPVALGFWLVHAPPGWRPLVWAGGAALFVFHGWTTAAWVARDAPRAEGRTQAYLELIGRLEALGVNRLYTPARPGAEMLNLYSRERIIASQMTAERYGPNFAALEREPAPAFLERQEDTLAPTLKALRASYETEHMDGYHLIHRIREMGRRYRQVPAFALRVSTSHGQAAGGQVVDRDMRSLWTSAQPKTPGMWVMLDLGRPHTVGMVRLWSPGEYHGNYAMDLRVETSVDGRTWHEAVERSPMDYLYWSGPRLYGWEWGYRWEARFAATEARFVRVTQYERSAHHPWVIAEAYVYEDVGVRGPGGTDEGAVLARIRERGLTRVYADRWMSARIADASRATVETIAPYAVPMAEFYVRLNSRVIQWGGRTGFVLEDADADEFERLLGEGNVYRLSREDFGRWVLFSPREPEPGGSDTRPGDAGWWWTGLGAVKTDLPRTSETRAGAALRRAWPAR
ncbi:MAG: discoidin domain-containing protein, partial [Candidatus Rokuibacteriota bacterium]